MPLQSYSQTLRLFRFYNHYRLVASAVLAGALFVSSQTKFAAPGLYSLVTLGYFCLNIFTGLLLLAGFKATQRHLLISLALDIVIINALMLGSSGINSGIGNLVVISVAASNILIPGRIGIFFAAFAALCTLFVAVYSDTQNNDIASSVSQAGLLGIIYFAAAFLLQNIAGRIRHSEALAETQAQDIAELEKLNHQIIQRMRTGILVCNQEGTVRLINQAASELLHADKFDRLPSPLLARLYQWQKNPAQRTNPFQIHPSPVHLQANFTRLQKDSGPEILIFLEDTSKITQQAQQLKLASLGRLTASIAHEIRNPLGAISHAAQLMAESEQLDSADRKMTEIILRHTNRVNGIIENILQLSRRSEPNTQEVELNGWVRRFIQDYLGTHSAERQLVYFTHPKDILARFDLLQIEQVLTNLIDNGIRYSQAHSGNARVDIFIGQNQQNEQGYIDIVDYGKGIDDDTLEHLFEPFFTTESNGTGLGLYLSRELCEANQASLSYIAIQTERVTPAREAAAKAATGACFRVTLAHPKRLI
ncbi:MAG: hypothetical protein H6999_09825 [Hahellaceae bacterium]|nr:hypothetical protein [Hahellaceae bacterium]MCP5170042.1 hypothetical protein [Hahellaceae bacterium]